ncbi:carbon-nitrogen hydrolase family protein [Marinobacterium arenosum]|uniref:carbon-nitrogen hydrolase family protein n=1 Tax=Marinobacterium arenosum TaxID=2862496 RepID=UPI001C960C59|nr:carbon-nitrogen hydrolase family protein [Marinobacterium arenosum]MBY4678575.1 carbon-nitrogen hydrolase family protein [Marinobacterium arenosum]
MNANLEIPNAGDTTVTPPRRIKLAACQYAIELFEDWHAYQRHLCTLVEQAVAEGAELLLLPEYAAMALTGQLEPAVRSDLQDSISSMQALIPRWFELCQALARKHRIWFCPGSVPVLDDDGIYRNRCWLFGPDGVVGHQDKLIMTRFEREQWFIGAGEGLRVFDTPFARLGILICYDNEFPALGRQLVEAGVDLILAPSCTDTMAGYHRVRIGCQARALEGQVAVLQSPTAGIADWSPAVDINTGRAALYLPPDYGLPDDGVLAQSPSAQAETSSWLIQQLDFAALHEVQLRGQVLTRRDWPEQFEHRVIEVATLELQPC